jgi:hypothetical protein
MSLAQQENWAAEYLSYIGAPQSQGNIEALTAQQIQEGSYYSSNPLNIRNGPGGAIGAYSSTLQGIKATYSIMESNDPGMLAALKQTKGTDPSAYINALSLGQWEGFQPGAAAANATYGYDVGQTLNATYGTNTYVPPTKAITTPPASPPVGKPGSGYGQSQSQADALAAAALARAQGTPANPRGVATVLNDYMNPRYQVTGTDVSTKSQFSFTAAWEDLIIPGKLLGTVIGDAIGIIPGASAIEKDVQIASNPNNWMTAIKEAIIRIAVFIIGGIIVFVGLNMLTNGGLMNVITSAIPVPVPV